MFFIIRIGFYIEKIFLEVKLKLSRIGIIEIKERESLDKSGGRK